MKIDRSIYIGKIDYMNVGQLKKLLSEAPDNATVYISTQAGDYNQMDYHSMTVTWKADVI